ncbi:MAG TPA: phosphatase PAP2 family protein [Rhizomicrobium sp.]|nr:phosphatase PAP2 family protein [Rhizomicrobium sp.]
MKFSLGAIAGAALVLLPAAADAKDTIEQIGTALAVAEPIFAGGVSIYRNDWTGLAEMTFTTGATVGTAYGLKYIVHEERPDHSDKKSFPSDTAALAFAPANYLWDRYGWRWGVPAYLVAGFVGYSRVEAKQHHWWDVAASAGLAFGYSKIFTTRYIRDYNLQGSAYVTPHGGFVTVSYNF